MPPLPLKAIRYSQLTVKTAGSAVPSSGHEVLKVEFEDAEGFIKTGFYKPLAKGYPTLLAKYSVAISILLRLSLSNRAAEERLVFNEKEKIIGTVSIAIPNYKPLLCYGQTPPQNPQEKELVCPSVETLMQLNWAELLVALWFIKDDDRHPGNLGAEGTIDNDMGLYHITSYMKGGRFIDSIFKPIPTKAMHFSSAEIDNFPIVEGRTHWPANTLPGNFNYYKHHLAAGEFQSLAKNPSLQTKTNTISFQEQFFTALLKLLLSYDSDILLARLEEYFGELDLDYLGGLEEEKVKLLEQTHPDLFQPKLNKQLFVDHIARVFQNEYNELYRAVVFYRGCEKNKVGIPVIGFSDFLRNKPSAYKKITGWFAERNKEIEASWSTLEKNLNKKENLILDVHCIKSKGKYNLKKIALRYHQIFRDAFTPFYGSILFEARQLANSLANALRVEPSPLMFQSKIIEVTDVGLTEAWQILGEPEPVHESKKINCDQNNSLRKGLIALEHFIEELHKAISDYYKIVSEKLSVESNQTFLEQVILLIQHCEKILYPALGGENLTIWAEDFTKIIENLQHLAGAMQFQRHLLSKDQDINTKSNENFIVLQRKHTDKEVIQTCLNALFDWVEQLENGILDAYIIEIIDQKYEPSVFNLAAKRRRGLPVKEYLKSSGEESGANRLANILSTGECESTSLNTLLITYLVPQMLEDTNQMDVNLLSVRDACNRKQFNAKCYAEEAQAFVKASERFTHMHAANSIKQFHETMYKWVAKLSRENFKKIILQALNDYQPSTFNFFSSKSRGEEVKKYFKENGRTNENILAAIFSTGGLSATSLNTILFTIILEKMQNYFSTKKNEQQSDKVKVIMKVKANDSIYLNSLAEHAKPYLKERKVVRCALDSR